MYVHTRSNLLLKNINFTVLKEEELCHYSIEEPLEEH